MNKANITYMEQAAVVICDRQCNKAWGWSLRPHHHLDEDEMDDILWLADDELGEAPRSPGSYEGGQTKPRNPDQFPNKWCVRQCERCVMKRPGEPIELNDWSKGMYNMPSRHIETDP